MKYLMLVKSTGKTLEIDPNPRAQKEFFRIIRNVTGLDRSFAEFFLKNGKPIDHPEYNFFSKGER